MRTRLGAHLSGLLAAAEAPLTAADLGRLSGRPAADVAALLPDAGDIRRLPGHPGTWELTDPDAVARVVRNLHSGPLPDGAEHRAPIRELALTPFRSALLAAVDSARTEWGWAAAPEFTLSPAFVRSMHGRRAERQALVATLSDPARSRLLHARHPGAAREQLLEAAADLAGATASTGDLEDVATLLLAAQQLERADGAVPRRLSPVFALLGDTERALALARLVRTDVPIELAYVALAAAQSGDARAEIIADSALALLHDAAPGALLRTAQAIAGAALYLSAGAARRLAATAHRMVEDAFADAPTPPHAEVAGLRTRQFRASRDHEWALGATTLATAGVAAIQASGVDTGELSTKKLAKLRKKADTGELPEVGAGERSIVAARDAAHRIDDEARRAVVLADIAARLAVRTTASAPSPALEAAADEIAEEAVSLASFTRDAETLVAVARLLSGGAAHDGDSPEPPARPDLARAARAARLALQLIAEPDAGGRRDGDRPGDRDPDGPRTEGATPDDTAAAAAGLLLAAARALPASERDEWAVPAARAIVAAGSTRLTRRPPPRPRSSGAPAALAEAAAILGSAGAVDEARAAAQAAADALARVPAPARARREAEVVAALLHATDDEVFAVARAAADAERDGVEGRWDAAAPALVAEAGIRLRHPHDAAPGEAEDAAALTPARAAIVERIITESVDALRHHDAATQLTTLADMSVRRVDPARARRLATEALQAAHVRDPLLVQRAEAALEAARAAHATPADTAPTLDSRAAAGIAASWVAASYPLDRLDDLVLADPAVGARVIRAIEADLAR